MRSHPIWFPCGLILLVLFCAAPPSRAGITISPVIIEAVVPADSTVNGAWQIRNTDTRPTTVTARAMLYDDYARQSAVPRSPDWLTLSATSVRLDGLAETTITYTLRPAPGSRGESLAMVFFSEKPTAGGASMQGRIGTAVYMLVAGTARPRLAVTGVRLVPDGAGDRCLLVDLRNDGNVHIRPRGTLTLTWQDHGPRTETVEMIPGAPVLPGQHETMATRSLHNAPSAGTLHISWSIATGTIDSRPGPVLGGDTLVIAVK